MPVILSEEKQACLQRRSSFVYAGIDALVDNTNAWSCVSTHTRLDKHQHLPVDFYEVIF